MLFVWLSLWVSIQAHGAAAWTGNGASRTLGMVPCQAAIQSLPIS
jgi:hypothetical protein